MQKSIRLSLAAILLFLSACSAPAPLEPQPSPDPTSRTTAPPAAPATPPGRTEVPSPTPGQSEAHIQFLRSDVVRESSDSLPPADLDGLVAGQTTFAFDIYQQIKEGPQENIFFSPYSISIALAMTYAGARGETENQMAEALNFSLPQDRLHPALNALDQLLSSRAESTGEDEAFKLNIVNSLWGQEGYPFLEEYLDLLARNYGAGLNLVDFETASEEARQVINQWVLEQTEQRIEDLLPPGSVDALTRLVLVNAIYFNASWAYPFEKAATQDAPFFLLDGSQVTAAMMHQVEQLPYKRANGYQVVELPYQGRQLSMIILLPDEGSFKEFDAALDRTTLEEAVADLDWVNLDLAFPKFTYESSFGLVETLEALGMPDAFDPRRANFSGMDGTQFLYIQDVVHKAFVAVDESGTEAAAATGVVVGIESMPAEPVTVKVDRPFIYIIRDNETGTILFLGRVLNPSG